MKLWCAALTIASLFAVAPGATAQAPPLRIFVNGAQVALPVPPEARDGIVLAPLAPLARAFGASTAWDAATRTLTVRGVSGTVLRLSVGQTTVASSDGSRTLPTAPVLRGRTLVGPAAAVLRDLGAYVKVSLADGTMEALSQVTGVAWRRDGAAVAVTISTTGPVRAAVRVLSGPDRVVVDLTSAAIRLQAPNQQIGDGAVLDVRSAQFSVRPYVTRVVFDLARPLAFQIATRPAVVALTLGGLPAEASGSTPKSSPSAGSPANTAAAAPANPPATGGASAAPGTTPESPPPAGSPANTAVVPAAPPATGGTSAAPGNTPGTRATASGTAPSADTASSAPRASPANQEGVPVASPPGPGDAVPEPLALPPLPEFPDRPGALHVQMVAYNITGGTGRLVIHASEPFTYEVHRWTYPDRFAIDVHGGVFRNRRQDLEIGSSAVRNIIVSQFQLRPNLARVLVRLYRNVAFAAAAADGGRTLIVTFADSGRVTARGQALGQDSSAPLPVIIDPGHGGQDVGAIGPTGLHEADAVLSIGEMAKAALERRGIPAVLTRTDDSFVSLEDRPDLAQRYGGILFVSIHANASRDPGVRGTTTYYETPESRALAEMVQAEVVHALGEPDRGIRTAGFYVIVSAPMPAILVETAFISNPREEAMLRDPAVRQKIAEAIAGGIAKFLAIQSQAPLP